MNRRDDSFRLDERFEEQARRTPERVALHDHGASITFAELRAQSDALAAALRARGIRDGGFVGLHMERSIGYVISVLAILKVNGAVVPLPPSYPAVRLREILSFAEFGAIVDDAATPLDPSLHGRVVRFDAAAAQQGEWSETAPGSADQPAFVLCSSGSTGQPKMIVRSHRSFFHRLLWTWANLPYAEGEVCCQKAHMTTTHAIYELFEPLLRGIPVHILSDHDARALETFWETVRAQSISRLLLVPSVLQASLDIPGFLAPPVKVVVLMGEYVHPQLAARAIDVFPQHTGIYSIYGSTEASSTFVCDVRRSWRRGEELPLGVPISPDVHDSVLSDDGAPVADGDVGMLHIGGTPLFSEYFKSPAQTAAAFVSATAGGERLYRTRDRVRRTRDGSLEFLGRTDNTVKIRGFRVELEEVERAILLHPEVRQCIVIASEDEPGTAALTAFVAPVTANSSTVYSLLRERLPAYMVPSTIIGVDAFPLTSSGKIDRQRLARAHARPAEVSADPLRSQTEQRISRVWQTVLKHGAFGSDSSFFEVGGSSLTAFSAVYRLRDEFGLDRAQLSDQSLYLHPTPSALATYIDGVLAGDAPAAPLTQSPLVTLKRGDDDGSRAPVFMISSAGGTLGAYEKLVKALRTTREVVGVRDPFLWGGRDPTLGFQRWIAEYVGAIRGRQPQGPYYIVAYSSAGALGYEIAQHLRRSGQEVALLALIDPLAIDRGSKRRFGYWSLESRFNRRIVAQLTLLAGWLRLAVPAPFRESGRAARDFNLAPTQADFLRLAAAARNNATHIRSVSALLELNTGLLFALTDAEMAAATPDRYLDALLSRVKRVAPEIDAQMIEAIVVQYQLQVRSHHAYRLQRYDGKTVLFDPRGPYLGLLEAQFRPYVSDLRVYGAELGEQSDRTRMISECFSERIRSHYQSMRDDIFVQAVAQKLDALLS